MQRLALWPGRAPGAAGGEGASAGLTGDAPTLSVHLPEPALATGAAVIVNPGGGYRTLASDHEGRQVARWLNRIGVAAFVLRYRVGPTHHSSVSLLDGQRAIRWVRHRAAEFGISPRRVGMLGFSAGGHLAVACATRYDDGDPDAADPIERQGCRPDFVVPVYAVVNGEVRGRKADEYTPTDTRVDANTPPAFLVHTHEDRVVSADQSLLFYRACLAAGVPAELHVFGFGEHGVGLAVGDPDVRHWTGLLHRWLVRSAFLTDGARMAVSGRLTIDGQAPGLAWVTLIPLDVNAPSARARTDRGVDGRFEIDAAHGPVAGPHRIEIHHLSDRHPFDASGDFTLDDSRVQVLHRHLRAGEPLELAV